MRPLKRLPANSARIQRASGPQFRWEVSQEIDPERPRWIKCSTRADCREVLADLLQRYNARKG